MKVAFWGKGNDSLDKVIEKVLTAEDAQKISDAALEAKCARWIDMIMKHALYTIKGFADEGRYYVKYKMYTTGEIVNENTQGWTSKMHNKVSDTVKERLSALGYTVGISMCGWHDYYIEISWDRKEEKK
jgi:hypothetical protein